MFLRKCEATMIEKDSSMHEAFNIHVAFEEKPCITKEREVANQYEHTKHQCLIPRLESLTYRLCCSGSSEMSINVC